MPTRWQTSAGQKSGQVWVRGQGGLRGGVLDGEAGGYVRRSGIGLKAKVVAAGAGICAACIAATSVGGERGGALWAVAWGTAAAGAGLCALGLFLGRLLSPLDRIVLADAAVASGNKGGGDIPEAEMPQDELGALMRSRAATISALRYAEGQALAMAASEASKARELEQVLSEFDQARVRMQAPPPVRLKVLVVDDNAAVRHVTGRMVGQLGHAVAEADSGAAALRALESEAFDFVLSDIEMPGMDGFELYQAAVDVRPDLSLRWAFVTGGADETTCERIVAVGIPVLQKPFYMQDLARLLTKPAGPRP